MSVIILSVSVALQLIAAYLSLRLIKITGQWGGWIFIAMAMTLMAVRKSIILHGILVSENPATPDLAIELVALFISALMLAGVIYIGPRFRKITSTNKALQQREAQLADAQRTAKLGIFEIDFRDGSVWWSEEMYRRYNYRRDEFTTTYENILEFMHPDDLPRVREAVERFRQSDSAETMELEYRMLTRNGNVIYINAIFTPEKDAAGQTIRCRCVSQDVSDKKQAEEALRKSEARLQEAQRVAEIGNWELDLITNTLHWSDEAYRIFNLVPQEFDATYEAFLECIHPDDRALVNEAYTDSVNNKKTYEVTHRVLLEDGTIKFVNERGRTFYDKSNRAIRSIGTVQDVTEQKSVEEEVLKWKYRYDSAVKASGNILYDWDSETNAVTYGGAIKEILGYTDSEMDGGLSRWVELIHPDDREFFNETIKGLIETKNDAYLQYRVRKRDGDYIYVEDSGQYIKEYDKKIVRMIGFVKDITERKKADEELRKLSRAVEASSSTVIITDLEGKMEYVNPKFTEVTGYTKEEAINQNVSLLSSGKTNERTYGNLWKTIKAGGVWKGEFQNRKKDGSLYWDRSSITGVKDEEDQITHFIAIQEDVTHEHVLKEELSYQASHDALTGLVNRYEFEHRAERLLSSIKDNNTEHALCFMDLDQFKVVNDTCGHTAGDELLRQLSIVLKQIVRKRDTLARLGGDEFGVLMEHCSLNHAHRVAGSLQKAIKEYQFSWEGRVFKVGVSIGLVAITDAIPSLTELLKRADAACYIAKEQGRHRIHVYYEEDMDLAKRHGEMQWVARIYQALEEDRLCLYAQAIQSLDHHQGEHYELLLRLIDEEGEAVPPGAFLPAAERYNLIEQLDLWVFQNAVTLLMDNPEFLKQIEFVSINLSGQSLTKDEILELIVSELKKSKIDGSKICFEITETAAIANLSTAINFISRLKEMGCRFALDDFGSGLSSFAYLKYLPVDFLKIDGIFVKDIVDDPINHAMVKSINEIGQVMGMKTIAEFMESDEIKRILEGIGVNYAQGYGIGKPQRFDALLGRSSKVVNI